MIENKDDTGPARNDVSIDSLDAAEKESECDPEECEDDLKRNRTATVEDQIGESECFEVAHGSQNRER